MFSLPVASPGALEPVSVMMPIVKRSGSVLRHLGVVYDKEAHARVLRLLRAGNRMGDAFAASGQSESFLRKAFDEGRTIYELVAGVTEAPPGVDVPEPTGQYLLRYRFYLDVSQAAAEGKAGLVASVKEAAEGFVVQGEMVWDSVFLYYDGPAHKGRAKPAGLGEYTGEVEAGYDERDPFAVAQTLRVPRWLPAERVRPTVGLRRALLDRLDPVRGGGGVTVTIDQRHGYGSDLSGMDAEEKRDLVAGEDLGVLLEAAVEDD